jgi:hypothetical protein
VFPVRYELDMYILFRRNSVFKGPIRDSGCVNTHLSSPSENMVNTMDLRFSARGL